MDRDTCAVGYTEARDMNNAHIAYTTHMQYYLEFINRLRHAELKKALDASGAKHVADIVGLAAPRFEARPDSDFEDCVRIVDTAKKDHLVCVVNREEGYVESMLAAMNSAAAYGAGTLS